MLSKFKNIISRVDHFLYKKFGSDKSINFLQNIKEAKIFFSYLNKLEKKAKLDL